MSALLDQHRHYTIVRARLRGMPRVEMAPPIEEPPAVIVKAPVEVYDRLGAVNRIIITVGWNENVRPGLLKGHKRLATITHARHIAMWLARHLTNGSWNQIGRVFRKDHTSVMHGVKRINRMMVENVVVRERIAFYQDLLREQ